MTEQRITLENQLEKKRALTQLLENRGWVTLQQIVQQQVDVLQNDILFTPCANLDSAIAQEYKKGQLEGRLSLAHLVMTELDVCESQIRYLKEKQSANSDDDSSRRGDLSDSGTKPAGGHAP